MEIKLLRTSKNANIDKSGHFDGFDYTFMGNLPEVTSGEGAELVSAAISAAFGVTEGFDGSQICFDDSTGMTVFRCSCKQNLADSYEFELDL